MYALNSFSPFKDVKHQPKRAHAAFYYFKPIFVRFFFDNLAQKYQKDYYLFPLNHHCIESSCFLFYFRKLDGTIVNCK